MKRSEFEYDFALFLAGTERRTVTKDHRRAAERAAYFAEKAGVVWDPEEPELPERVGVAWYSTSHEANKKDALKVPSLTPGGDPSFIVLGNEELREAVVREAARRYNALGRIMNEVLGPGKIVRYEVGMPILTILEEEGVTRG